MLAAIDHIRQRIDTPITLPQVARIAHLSPGRFRHLFVAETGMPLRTYVLWRRLLQVWTLLTQVTVSVAGCPCGRVSADSAHLSRTLADDVRHHAVTLQMSGPLTRRERNRPTEQYRSPVAGRSAPCHYVSRRAGAAAMNKCAIWAAMVVWLLAAGFALPATAQAPVFTALDPRGTYPAVDRVPLAGRLTIAGRQAHLRGHVMAQRLGHGPGRQRHRRLARGRGTR